MENASKALLIAAAVLIVVLLVAFGMRIFNQSQGAGDAQGTANSISQGITGGTDKLQGEIVANKTFTMEELREYLKLNVYMTGNEANAHGFRINKKTYKTEEGEKTIKAGIVGGFPGFDKPGKKYIFREYTDHTIPNTIKILCYYEE